MTDGTKKRADETDPDDPYQEKVARISETVSKWHQEYLASFAGSIFRVGRGYNTNPIGELETDNEIYEKLLAVPEFPEELKLSGMQQQQADSGSPSEMCRVSLFLKEKDSEHSSGGSPVNSSSNSLFGGLAKLIRFWNFFGFGEKVESCGSMGTRPIDLRHLSGKVEFNGTSKGSAYSASPTRGTRRTISNHAASPSYNTTVHKSPVGESFNNRPLMYDLVVFRVPNDYNRKHAQTTVKSRQLVPQPPSRRPRANSMSPVKKPPSPAREEDPYHVIHKRSMDVTRKISMDGGIMSNSLQTEELKYLDGNLTGSYKKKSGSVYVRRHDTISNGTSKRTSGKYDALIPVQKGSTAAAGYTLPPMFCFFCFRKSSN